MTGIFWRWLLDFFRLPGLLTLAGTLLLTCGPAQTQRAATVLTGPAAFGDWTSDAPGVRRRITVADLPMPYHTLSVDNGPRMVPRPPGALPKAPPGFIANLFASDLNNPRAVVTAPNGDLFVAESEPGRVRLLRDADGDGKAEESHVFASGLALPFGMAFYPPGREPRYLYVANTDSVVRFPYKNGKARASGPPEPVVRRLPGYGRLRGGGHWTRDLQFSRDGRTLYVSVGSLSNVSDDPSEKDRACIHAYDSDGGNFRLFATGIRNAVGLALHPATGELWASVNERDGLGDDLVPDYVTRVRPGGFYGWPWYYLGPNQDPRHAGQRLELKKSVIVPDVLIQAHSASLDLTFYTGRQFPSDYRNHIFAAEHGSWNRARRTGYKVIRIPVRYGRATGDYEDFLTGFVTEDGNVWGRPVGVTVARDGALIVTDDGGNVAWRVAYSARSLKGSL
jgi:glucose/arabinose dehydrogenase